MSTKIYEFILPDGRTCTHAAETSSISDAWSQCEAYDPSLRIIGSSAKNVKGLDTIRVTLSHQAKAPKPEPARTPYPCAHSATPTPATPTIKAPMLNLASLRSQFFAPIACVVISLLDSKVGVKANDGTIKVADFPKEGNPTLVSNPFTDLSATVPAFAIRTAVDKVERGDIILLDGAPVWVASFKDGVLNVLRTDGTLQELVVAKNAIFQDNAVMKVTNPFSASALGTTNSLLPLLLMQAEDGADQNQLGMLLAMGALGGKDGGDLFKNPMMMMALLGKGGLGGGAGGLDMKTLMLMQMMGGAQGGAAGMNPLMLLALAK